MIMKLVSGTVLSFYLGKGSGVPESLDTVGLKVGNGNGSGNENVVRDPGKIAILPKKLMFCAAFLKPVRP
jgi:hypothetical protein